MPVNGDAPFAGRSALVTGAAQGIGRAISMELAAQGAKVALVGRSAAAVDRAALGAGERCQAVVADIDVKSSVKAMVDRLLEQGTLIDVLVHCAGEYVRGTPNETREEDLDRQYALAARAPYMLTQELWPLMRKRPADIVFMGSPVLPRRSVGAFAMGQAAQQALIATLREETADEDVRILCVFPGRTASPRQERIFALEGRLSKYEPERLLQPDDIAAVALNALSLPRRAEVTEIRLRPARGGY